jgi:acyl-CoA synthetase (AMP-forming)/AMP-acid ligase II
MKTLRDLLLTSSLKAPHQLFVVNAQRQLTYKETFEQASLRASFLLHASIQPQERVIIVDADPLETTLWLLACSLVGIVFIVLHQDISARHMRNLLPLIEPAGVIDTRPHTDDVYQGISSLRLVVSAQDGVLPGVEVVPLPTSEILETDPAFFVSTSGSTGTPKLIICHHQAVLAVTSAINAYLLHTDEDRIGHLLSLSFVYGLYQLFLAMERQATVCFLGKFRSSVELLTQLRTWHITGFPALRSLFASLVRLPASHFQELSLRYITSAGDYVPPSLIEQTVQKFGPACQFFSMYGLSECSRALYLPPELLLQKPTSVGRPIPGTRAFIVDEAGRPVEPGEIGELVIEGPHIMHGYWRSPAEAATAFTRGPYGQPQLHTGDLFFQDEQLDFYFVGRKNDLIKSRGYRISPREVELAIIAADPLVRDCMVYGVDDNLLGQAIHALITVNDPAHTVQAVFECCRTAMDAHLVPTRIEIVEAFPVTLSGKYRRQAAASRQQPQEAFS